MALYSICWLCCLLNAYSHEHQDANRSRIFLAVFCKTLEMWRFFFSAFSYDELFCGLQVRSLLGTSVEWLYFILQAFNAGDLTKYQELCVQYQSALTAQPALVENEKKLWEKINILCLMELIFR